MVGSVKTDIGKVRQGNEDSYIFHPPQLFAVADGMGGHAAGEIASSIAVEVCRAYVTAHMPDTSNPQEVLLEAIQQANHKVYEASREQAGHSGMGTTLTAIWLADDQVYWAHVGDSRLYIWRENGLEQITSDHSLVWELFSSGSITHDEMHSHPQRNLLTRAVGTEATVRIDSGVCRWTAGEGLLLCSDGLTTMLDDQQLNRLLADNQQLGTEHTAATLLAAANAAGGLDNITLLWLKNDE